MQLRLVFWVCFLLANATATFAQDSTRYRLEISYTWSAETHPTEFPVGGHMSKLFGAIHNRRYVLFRDGQSPSSGLRLVAENGRNTIVSAEFEEALRRRRIGAVLEGPNAPTVPNRISIEFEVETEHPYLSFVSMIAPSPDWFTGVSNLALKQGDAWVEEIALPLWAWDAGTDSGTTYLAENAETQPRQSVRLLATKHFLGTDGLRAVGHMVLTRIQ